MAEAAPSPYPTELVRDVVLGDGTRLRVRPIRPDDAPRLVELYDRLSAHTAYQRFFTATRRLPPDWARFHSSVDYRRQLALVVEAEGHPGELIAVARYEPTDREDTAEIAFVVQDGWQNRGLGTTLLDDLLRAGEARGIRRFVAYVLADNTRMLDLLRRFTDVQEHRLDDGVVTLVCARRRGPRVDDGVGGRPSSPSRRGPPS